MQRQVLVQMQHLGLVRAWRQLQAVTEQIAAAKQQLMHSLQRLLQRALAIGFITWQDHVNDRQYKTHKLQQCLLVFQGQTLLLAWNTWRANATEQSDALAAISRAVAG